ncbi:MAG: hypothetical protein QM763_13425 [Agriterribacter sp.]
MAVFLFKTNKGFLINAAITGKVASALCIYSNARASIGYVKILLVSLFKAEPK